MHVVFASGGTYFNVLLRLVVVLQCFAISLEILPKSIKEDKGRA
jgi:hypothetical protein